MPPDRPATWVVEDFGQRLDEWTRLEDPPPDLLILINRWGLDLLEQPLRDADRAEGLGGDIWFAIIPGTFDGTRAVTLTFIVDAESRTVRCSFFGYQTPPYGA